MLRRNEKIISLILFAVVTGHGSASGVPKVLHPRRQARMRYELAGQGEDSARCANEGIDKFYRHK